ERHAERSERAINYRVKRVGRGWRNLAEKNVAWIFVEQRGKRIGMRTAPCLDRLLRCAIRRELAALDQHASDRAKRMTVLIGVTDSHHAAVVELDSSRTLNLQEEGIDGLGDECESFPR